MQWRDPVPATGPGVYVVALTDAPRSENDTLPNAPLDASAFSDLFCARPELRLDGHATDKTELQRRIADFWLPHEVVLYIGRAGTSLRNRVNQYYKTPIGANKPHAGGWWLKTLSNLNQLSVHYVPTGDDKTAELAMLRHFSEYLLAQPGLSLPDSANPMPFANLRGWHDRIKLHRITGATGEFGTANGAEGSQKPVPSASPRAEPPDPSRGRAGSTRAGYDLVSFSPRAPQNAGRSQRVTAADLRAGQIRFPRGSKRFFPTNRVGALKVVFKGLERSAPWDPRTGPDRERSGVLAFGRGALEGIVAENEILSLDIDSGSVSIS